MKGHLYKKLQPEGWYVTYDVDGFTKSELLLHPYLEKYYFLDEDAEGGEVEFEIEDFYEQGMEGVVKVAKLIRPEYPEIEGTLALCNDKVWDDIYDEYSTEQWPPFGGPFTDAVSFIDWLKQNYKAPEKV